MEQLRRYQQVLYSTNLRLKQFLMALFIVGLSACEPKSLPMPQVSNSPEPDLWVECSQADVPMKEIQDFVYVNQTYYLLNQNLSEEQNKYSDQVYFLQQNQWLPITNQKKQCLNPIISKQNIEKDAKGNLWLLLLRIKNNQQNYQLMRYHPKSHEAEIFLDLENRDLGELAPSSSSPNEPKDPVVHTALIWDFVIPYGSEQMYFNIRQSDYIVRESNYFKIDTSGKEQFLFDEDDLSLPFFDSHQFTVNPNNQNFYFNAQYVRKVPYKSERIQNEGLPNPFEDEFTESFTLKDILFYTPNILISSLAKHRILKSDFIAKEITSLAGNDIAGFKDGKGEEAQFNNPTALDRDDDGNIFVLDAGNKAIRKVTPDGVVSTVVKVPSG